ncbi:MAG: YkvI family membrane protein [Vitreimonas sp.]
MAEGQSRPSWFQRYLLPGFAFKAVVIGGGYATGRELAEFFLPSGPAGGVAAMLLAMVAWSAVCTLTFLFARATQSFDYRSFFRNLLGPLWIVFEIAYLLFIVLVLAVFGAAAGEIGAALFGLPQIVGTLALVVSIAAVVAFGNKSVEGLFKWVTIFLYGVYAVFAVLALAKFGDRSLANLAAPTPMTGWVTGGLTYAGYNVICAIVILPVLRHLTSSRDAVVAGVLAGPLAIWPALVFFICMVAFYPAIGAETLPSDYLLRQLDLPVFHFLFQLMIFSALLESGAGSVHAFNERVAGAWRARRGRDLSACARLLIAGVVLVGAIFLAQRVGLVDLIGQGYRALAIAILAVFIAPLLTIGVWRLLRAPAGAPQQA